MEINSKCSITTDFWLSKTQMSYLGVTCHFFDKEYQFKNKVLCLKYVDESKTADNIQSFLNEILNDWRIHTKV